MSLSSRARQRLLIWLHEDSVPTPPKGPPQSLSSDDVLDFLNQADSRELVVLEDVTKFYNIFLDELKKQDPVRVWRIKKDMAWVNKRITELGINKRGGTTKR